MNKVVYSISGKDNTGIKKEIFKAGFGTDNKAKVVVGTKEVSIDEVISAPEGGTPGQVLTKTATATEWANPASSVEANPTLSGGETDLTSIKIADAKYKVAATDEALTSAKATGGIGWTEDDTTNNISPRYLDIDNYFEYAAPTRLASSLMVKDVEDKITAITSCNGAAKKSKGTSVFTWNGDITGKEQATAGGEPYPLYRVADCPSQEILASLENNIYCSSQIISYDSDVLEITAVEGSTTDFYISCDDKKLAYVKQRYGNYTLYFLDMGTDCFVSQLSAFGTGFSWDGDYGPDTSHHGRYLSEIDAYGYEITNFSWTPTRTVTSLSITVLSHEVECEVDSTTGSILISGGADIIITVADNVQLYELTFAHAGIYCLREAEEGYMKLFAAGLNLNSYTKMNSELISSGSQTAGKVLSADGNGGVTWTTSGGGGLPTPANAGDAMVYNGHEWVKQTGYGYEYAGNPQCIEWDGELEGREHYMEGLIAKLTSLTPSKEDIIGNSVVVSAYEEGSTQPIEYMTYLLDTEWEGTSLGDLPDTVKCYTNSELPMIAIMVVTEDWQASSDVTLTVGTWSMFIPQ